MPMGQSPVTAPASAVERTDGIVSRLIARVARLLPNLTARAAASLLLLLFAMAGLAPLVAPHDSLSLAPREACQPPSAAHPFGTDHLGRDVMARVIWGTRPPLTVGALTVVLSGLIGCGIGIVSGYFPRLDTYMMRVVDAWLAFPALLLALAIVALLGPSQLNMVVALALVYIPRLARVMRSCVLTLREEDYVLAARAIGATDRRIIGRHILPNSLGAVTVQLSFTFAYAMLAEASLSYLGLGSARLPSWGGMLSEGRQYLHQAPWIMFFPGVCLSAAILSLNSLGDTLRDQLDPKLRRPG